MGLAKPENVGNAPILRKPNDHLVVNELCSEDCFLAYKNLLGLRLSRLGMGCHNWLVDLDLCQWVYYDVKLHCLLFGES